MLVLYSNYINSLNYVTLQCVILYLLLLMEVFLVLIDGLVLLTQDRAIQLNIFVIMDMT